MRRPGPLRLAGLPLMLAVACPVLAQAPASPAGAASRSATAPTLEDLRRRVEEQRRRIEEQEKLIASQREEMEKQQTLQAEQDKKLADLQEQLLALQRRLDELQGEMSAAAAIRQQVEERLKRAEEATLNLPEVPPDVVTAGDFPGSLRIPGTDAAIKFGGQIRAAAVFTLAPLGSDDRFLAYSIPVGVATNPGQDRRTDFNASGSRFNFEMRTPVGAEQVRVFLEGDFAGSGNTFRLRHAYSQYQGFLFGQTWSTFSDPSAEDTDLDFEGINSRNLIRQTQFRYQWILDEKLSVAASVETPAVSLTGGSGINVIPDLIGRVRWKFKKIGHLQAAAVYRGIRGESTDFPDEVVNATGWGIGLSGVVPFHYRNLTDRFIFQITGGEGIARYINDLKSLGEQDAVFDPVSNDLVPLRAYGWYLDHEHMWKRWQRTRDMNLRSSVIWSYVTVRNTDFQPGDAYHQTSRLAGNLVFSPIPRIDMGIEYIQGSRENKNGSKGYSNQVQIVSIFRF